MSKPLKFHQTLNQPARSIAHGKHWRAGAPVHGRSFIGADHGSGRSYAIGTIAFPAPSGTWVTWTSGTVTWNPVHFPEPEPPAIPYAGIRTGEIIGHRIWWVIYEDDEPYLSSLAVGIKKALVVAGGRFADEKMTHLRGVINIMADLVEIKAKKPTMRSDTVRLANGVTSIAYRPSFMPWEMEIPVTFNASIIGEAQILNLFQIAGFAVGLGAWRPECNGVFGQFELMDTVAARQAAE